MADIFKSTRKDKIFDKLIPEIKSISRKYSKRFDIGAPTPAKKYTEHTIEFDMEGYFVRVELREK